MTVGNVAVYMKDRKQKTLNAMNLGGIVMGMLIGLLGTVFYLTVSYRTISSLKLNRYKDLVLLERV